MATGKFKHEFRTVAPCLTRGLAFFGNPRVNAHGDGKEQSPHRSNGARGNAAKPRVKHGVTKECCHRPTFPSPSNLSASGTSTTGRRGRWPRFKAITKATSEASAT